jgi:hypothetical protein
VPLDFAVPSLGEVEGEAVAGAGGTGGDRDQVRQLPLDRERPGPQPDLPSRGPAASSKPADQQVWSKQLLDSFYGNVGTSIKADSRVAAVTK